MKIPATFWLASLALLVCCGALGARQESALDTTVDTEFGDEEDFDSDFATDELLLFEDIPIVYGASRFEQSASEAPASVSVITKDDIRRYGYRTLAALLNSERGLFATSDRNYSYVGARGFAPPGDYNNRVLLLVDGHRINDTVYGSAAIGNDFVIDVDLIERVEIIRGPSSSLYGTSGFFAVVNVTTRGGQDVNGLEVKSAAGTFHQYKGRLTYGTVFENGLEVLFSGTLGDSEGDTRLYYSEFDDPTTNFGIAEDSDEESWYGLFGKIKFRDFTLEGAYKSREKEFPTAAWGVIFNDSRTKTVDTYSYVELGYDHQFEGDVEVTTSVGYQNYYYHGDYLYDYGYAAPVVNKDQARGDSLSAEILLSKKLDRHQVILGAQYEHAFRRKQRNWDEAVYVNDNRDTNSYGLFAQEEFRIAKGVILNAGLRYDYYETIGGATNPRVALMLKPRPKTDVKLLFGTAFRAPNAYELYYSDSGNTQKSNPDLDAETITTYEVVIDQYLGDRLRISGSGFYNEIENLISLVTDPTDGLLVFRNGENVFAHGAEFEVEGRWSRGLRGRVSYSYQRTRDTLTHRRLTNSPEHLVKARVTLPIVRDALFGSVEVRHMSERKTIQGAGVSSSVVTDLTLLSKDLVKGFEFSASLFNVFDQKFNDPAGAEHVQNSIEQDGRTLWVELGLNF